MNNIDINLERRRKMPALPPEDLEIDQRVELQKITDASTVIVSDLLKRYQKIANEQCLACNVKSTPNNLASLNFNVIINLTYYSIEAMFENLRTNYEYGEDFDEEGEKRSFVESINKALLRMVRKE